MSKTGRIAIDWREAVLAGVALATFAVFLPTLLNGFVVWDDDLQIIDNPAIHGLSWDHLRSLFVDPGAGYFLGLNGLSFMVDYSLWGLNPAGFHLTNLLIHSVCAVLVYLLSGRLLRPAADSGPGGGRDLALGAGFAALAFSLHPLRVESVAWVSDRRDLLCGAFTILSVLCYVRASESEKRWRWLAACFAGFVLATVTRIVGVTLPAVLILLDVYPLRRLRAPFLRRSIREDRAVWLEKLPYAAALVLFVSLYMANLGGAGCGMDLANFGYAQRAAQAFFGAAFYPRKTLLPFDLSPFYHHPSFDPWAAPYVSSAAAVAALTGLLLAFRRRWPAGLAAWAVYLVVLSPFLGLFPCGRHVAADRYSYLSCLPWAVLAGAGLLALLRARRVPRSPVLAAAALVLAGFGFLSVRQTRVWKDTETLWTQALAVQEDHPYVHGALGTYLAQKGRLDEALVHLRRAFELAPKDPPTLNSLGCVLAGKGRRDEAESLFSEALRLSPDFREARLNLEKVMRLKADPGAAPSKLR